jgi:uncharacterized protein with PQ loop repeat
MENQLIDVLGWIGQLSLTVCAFPQVIKSIKDGHSNGVSWGTLILWFFGEVLSCSYVIFLGKWPLIINYVFNVLAIPIIIWYKMKTRKTPP